jgi:hypothetical protein
MVNSTPLYIGIPSSFVSSRRAFLTKTWARGAASFSASQR